METNITTPALVRLRKKIESLAPISDEHFQLLASVMQEKHFDKGEVMLKEGQVSKHYYFILSGCIRNFYIENGKEINVNFYFEDDVACDFMSFRDGKPATSYMVAMEDCQVYYGSKGEAAPILLDLLQPMLFRFYQDLYFKEEEHSNIYKLHSPEDRYQYLLEHQPHYLQRVPLIHLASYLGMSRETLTRIRKKIS